MIFSKIARLLPRATKSSIIISLDDIMTKLYFKNTVSQLLRFAWMSIAVVYSTTLTVNAQPNAIQEKKQSIFEYLTVKEGTELELITDLTKLNGSRKSDDYQPAILKAKGGKTWKLDLKTRGKYRRKNGFFPPIKLKFPKKEIVAQGFSEHNEIKITLPFYEGDGGNELVVREYLAYRMYESLTIASMRARLVKMTIIDSHVESWKHTTYCILLEDDDELCTRLDATEINTFGMDPDSLQMHQAALVSAFNYMIGNADWEIAGLRNVKMLRPNQGEKVVLIPYDFDFSGLVNAPYSKAANLSGLKTTKQRFLMADGIKTEQLRRAFAVLNKEKATLLKMVESKYLKYSAQDEIKAYLNTFFNQLEIDSVIGASISTPQID
jgi:hypothetical protein